MFWPATPAPRRVERSPAADSLRAVRANSEVVAHGDLLVLAVKPQSMKALLEEISPLLTERHLIVSIAAGVSLKQLSDGLGGAAAFGARDAEHALFGRRQRIGVHAGRKRDCGRRRLGGSADESGRRGYSRTRKSARRRDGFERQRAGFRLSDDRGVVRRRRAHGAARDAATALAAQTVLGSAKMVLETGIASRRAEGSGGESRRHHHRGAARAGARRRARGDHGRGGGGDATGDGVGEKLMASANAGKTGAEIFAAKKAKIKRAPLDDGSPDWDDIRDLTWEDIEERAGRQRTGIPNDQETAQPEEV